MKPFTTIGALIFLLVAAAHAYRAYAGLPVAVDGYSVSVMMSWVAAGVAAVLGLMMLMESRR